MKTLVVGASPNPLRYAFSAVEQLRWKGHEVIAWGRRPGRIADVHIQTEWPDSLPDLDTITLYIGPANQEPFYDRILALNPRRIIFNPGTENPILMEMAIRVGIDVVPACTLVMLAVGNYEDSACPSDQ